ncbi:MAG: pyrroloquinoline quinone precursor peptide PqqA [Caulobacteraceae bacterium]
MLEALTENPNMVWTKPEIVEIVCGAEINAYVSAEIV